MHARLLAYAGFAIAVPIATWSIAASSDRAPIVTQALPALAKPQPQSKPQPAAKVAKPALPAPAPTPASYVIKRVLPIEGPMRFGDHVWDDKGVPVGEIVITVDLVAQTLSVFQGGYEIGAAAILYGMDSKPTPLGVFPITQKDADHVSNLYGAPMPYMLRLTNDGVSIHGSNVIDGEVTHGCIGVPTPFAKRLFGVAKLGTKVIITRGEMLDVGKPVTAA